MILTGSLFVFWGEKKKQITDLHWVMLTITLPLSFLQVLGQHSVYEHSFVAIFRNKGNDLG